MSGAFGVNTFNFIKLTMQAAAPGTPDLGAVIYAKSSSARVVDGAYTITPAFTDGSIANLLDGNVSTYAQNVNALPHTFKVDFGAARKINRYGFGNWDASNGGQPKTWTFEGSNNGTDWTVIETRTNEAQRASGASFYFDIAEQNYRYYRWVVTVTWDATYIGGELYLYSPRTDFFAKNDAGTEKQLTP